MAFEGRWAWLDDDGIDITELYLAIDFQNLVFTRQLCFGMELVFSQTGS